MLGVNTPVEATSVKTSTRMDQMENHIKTKKLSNLLRDVSKKVRHFQKTWRLLKDTILASKENRSTQKGLSPSLVCFRSLT